MANRISPDLLSSSQNSNHRAFILGSGLQATKAADAILNCAKLKTELIGFVDSRRTGMWRYRDIPLIGNYDDLLRLIQNARIDFLAVAPEPQDFIDILPLVQAAEQIGVTIYLMTQFFQPGISKSSAVNIGGIPTLRFSSVPEKTVSLGLKEMLDRISALFGIIAITPLLAITSLIIKLDSPGPVLFKQPRTGKNGRPFLLWKFRTMTVDAEKRKEELQSLNEMSGPVFKIKNDPRVTRVGRFLRKYSIDELPQLFNILMGEMSLVGPRPPLPSEVEKFEPWQRRKLSVKPGLTCLWQTNGRNNVDFDEWMKLDLKYIDNWSLWEDAKIIVRTIPTVLKGSGI